MRQLVRINTPRTPQLVDALTQKGIETRGSVVGEPEASALPEESFIAELEAATEQDAVKRLREVVDDPGQLGLEPLGPAGDLPSPSSLKRRLDA